MHERRVGKTRAQSSAASPHPGQIPFQPRSQAHGIQTQSLTRRGKRTRRTPTCRSAKTHRPSQNQFSAEGPLFQPSLALNIDPAPEPSNSPTSLRPTSVTPTTPSTSPPPTSFHPTPLPHQAPVPLLSLIQPNRTPACTSSSPRLLYLFKNRGHPVAAAVKEIFPFI